MSSYLKDLFLEEVFFYTFMNDHMKFNEL